jgi:uncharacterized protein YdbL (DUF1318 family)
MRPTTIAVLCATLVALACAPATRAADTKEELQKRFEARLPQIEELKKAGTVGETDEGYLDFVAARGDKAGALVDEENGDRRKLYDLIAAKTGTTADVVAKRAAGRNFERAKSGEFLKEKGKWRKKA